MKTFISIILAAFILSCSDDIAENYGNSANTININLVEQGNALLYSPETNLDTLELKSTPWVESSDILFYDWSAQTFYLNTEINKEEHSGLNFVVSSGDKRLFMGVFWPMHISSIPMIPAIMPEDNWFTPKDVIQFHSFGWPFPESLTENDEFKAELIKSDLLREGIEVEITELKRKSSTSLEYSFRVTNLESGNIYILDPNKMGASRFHYYTNGISLNQNDNYYWPNNFETTASEKISSRWYYKLLPGKSISRTVQMKGYQALPLGKVNASFSFPGSTLKETGEWKKPDGRIWIGSLITKAEITIKP